MTRTQSIVQTDGPSACRSKGSDTAWVLAQVETPCCARAAAHRFAAREGVRCPAPCWPPPPPASPTSS
eukprot:7382752-Prymnesium_polylepis.1